ncbi:hypothetical protein [Neobacillus jeddahensis]|uniref:hypothetical protein n=1 Tax=Neobacillus jeddahensis TaxID=1461580 RepID=UPI0005A7E846|nr:hypothetical protein [Neobacillus jeddahensis]
MKKRTFNFQFFSNHIETLDFKTFCEGGSTEYVEAKKKLKKLYRQQQQNNLHNKEIISRPSTVHPSFPVYSLYINPFALIDINFLIAAGCVVIVAILEKKLGEHGIIEPAAILSGLLKIGFPVVAFASILILISKLGAFL